MMWYEREYLDTHDEGVSVELEELAEEVYAALNAGGPTIDLENVSNEEKMILDSGDGFWIRLLVVKCKPVVIN